MCKKIDFTYCIHMEIYTHVQMYAYFALDLLLYSGYIELLVCNTYQIGVSFGCLFVLGTRQM